MCDCIVSHVGLHPGQTLGDEPDGSLVVRFRAGGFLEIVHHLMTWGPAVTILEPQTLIALMRETVAALAAHYGPLSRSGEGQG
jgi:predicted DNA-binding transcriptional regulator YafY